MNKYFELMLEGKRITISGKGYEPATFFINENRIWVSSKELGTFQHVRKPSEINQHFENMIQEGLSLTTN